MASKHIYAKSISGVSDFVYVDLLPDVKRSRQFNVNVIASLFLAVVLSYVLIYMPYSDATVEYERLKALNSDLKHELTLTNEEFVGYEINLDTISFEEEIELLLAYRIDFNNYFDDIELLTNFHGGNIIYTEYLAESSRIHVTIVFSDELYFSLLNTDLLELNWVESIDDLVISKTGDALQNSATYSIGVDRDVE